MKSLTLVFLLGLSLPINSAQAKTGFESGDHFSTRRLEGQISIMCDDDTGGGIRVNNERCDGNFLTPTQWDYFVDDTGIDADKIQIKVTQASGQLREQSMDFLSGQGRSRTRFNIWVDTAFQKALLRSGNNHVSYTFFKGRSIVKQGSFSVMIEQGENRVCESRTYRSNFPEDCQYGAFCGKYFKDINYCE